MTLLTPTEAFQNHLQTPENNTITSCWHPLHDMFSVSRQLTTINSTLSIETDERKGYISVLLSPSGNSSQNIDSIENSIANKRQVS